MTNPLPALPVPIPLHQLVADREFQVRDDLDPRTVKRYADAMRDGTEFPPIEVAVIDGLPYIVDGFHRFEATSQNGWREILANVRQMTRAEASQIAATANLTHGLKLKDREVARAKRKMLAAYLAQGKHLRRTAGGTFAKSYREIARDFSGLISKSSVQRMIRDHHPGVYRRYFGQEEPQVHPSEDAVEDRKEMDALQEAQSRLQQVEAYANAIRSPALRGDFIRSFEEALERYKQGGTFSLEALTDF